MLKTHYDLDHSDMLIGVGGEWDRFAQDNDAPNAMADNVLGNRLWDHIQTHSVASYLNALFFTCRELQTRLVLPYRCDSPTVPQLFTMQIIPIGQGGLRVEHIQQAQPLSNGSGAPIRLTDRHASVKCSVCCSVKVGADWIDPFATPDQIDFPKGLGLCRSCKTEAMGVISAALDSRKNVLSWRA